MRIRLTNSTQYQYFLQEFLDLVMRHLYWYVSLHQLKSVAIKLKKRVAELTAQLKAAEETRNKALAERQESASKDSMKAASKTIQARLLSQILFITFQCY